MRAAPPQRPRSPRAVAILRRAPRGSGGRRGTGRQCGGGAAPRGRGGEGRPRSGARRPLPARGRRSPVFEVDLEQAAIAAEETLNVLLPDVVAQAADVHARHIRGRRGREGERGGKE